MKILIIAIYYPTPTNYANSRFIHERVIEYVKFEGVQVLVASIKNKLDNPWEYVHEGIDVRVIRTEAVQDLVENWQPDIIGIHFFEGSLMKWLIPHISRPVVVWVHGVEALGWYRRLFDFHLSFSFLKAIRRNMIQMWRFRKLIKLSNKSGKIFFVFVSNWMKRITETDAVSKTRYFDIIPNPVDTELFKYQGKNRDMRKNILIIRSFESNKYANDIAIKAILYLSNNPIFKDLHFEIYGDGSYYDQLTSPLKEFSNVTLHKMFVEHDGIPEIHQKHGIFLCPTRQDSQGVSMCEAMSSGLVPIASDNTAIPEFVEDKKSGFLTKSHIEIADSIIYLYENPDVFLTMSAAAAATMREQCAKSLIIKKEIEIMREILRDKNLQV